MAIKWCIFTKKAYKCKFPCFVPCFFRWTTSFSHPLKQSMSLTRAKLQTTKKLCFSSSSDSGGVGKLSAVGRRIMALSSEIKLCLFFLLGLCFNTQAPPCKLLYFLFIPQRIEECYRNHSFLTIPSVLIAWGPIKHNDSVIEWPACYHQSILFPGYQWGNFLWYLPYSRYWGMYCRTEWHGIAVQGEGTGGSAKCS